MGRTTAISTVTAPRRIRFRFRNFMVLTSPLSIQGVNTQEGAIVGVRA